MFAQWNVLQTDFRPFFFIFADVNNFKDFTY